MLFYQMLYQRQAQSGSAFSVALYLEKRLKYFPEVYSGNSIAVVFYGNDDPVSFRSGLKAKPYPILRMFHGIVQQIAYDLGQSLFVRIEHDLVIGYRDAGPDSLLLHLLGKLQHTSFQQIVQIHIRPIERESRTVDFLKIEQLIRQIQQPVDIGTHDFEVLLIIRRPDPRADDLFVRPPDQ